MFIEGLVVGSVLLLLGVPIAVLSVECWAALGTANSNDDAVAPDLEIAVLIPAHNEAAGIGETLATLVPQLGKKKRAIVVADNCDDDTASVAREYGVTVLERENKQQRGKGYALDFGLHYLAQDPPDVVVMVDADCEVKPGAIASISQIAARQQRPVQALYLMEQPANPSPKDSVSALAFLVKNLVRPLGLTRLGFPCLLTGTGMAFPWSAISEISLASGNIVEDMQLGLDLAVAGYSPLFCASALVMGRLPQQESAAKSQRTRWEHGHLQTLLNRVPWLLGEGLKQRRLDLVAIALELAVPPLSLLVLLWLAVAVVCVILGWAFSLWLPGRVVAILGAAMAIAIIFSWAKFGRETISKEQLLSIPGYILWKLPLYFGFIRKRQQEWVRTERDIDASKS